MHMARRRAIRAVTLRSVKWFLFLAAPFSILFFETWLRLRTVETDYVSGALRAQVRDLRKEINELEGRIDGKKTIPRLGVKAAELGLVPPEPGQVEIVYARVRDNVSPDPSSPAELEMARLDSP